MKSAVALSVVTVFLGAAIYAQTAPPPAQTPPAPRPQTAPPAGTPPAPRPAARPAATPTVTIQASDSSGLPLGNVQVTATGPLAREGVTGDDGILRFVNMRVGGYRLRFAREGSITVERDIIVRTSEPLLVDVMLNAAPPPPKPAEPVRPPPAPETSKTPLGPPSEPKVTPIPTFLEKNFIGGREPRKDSPLGCTSTGSSTLVQLREALLNQVHDDTDEWIYVVAGEGTLRIGSAEQRLQAGTFALVPHTLAHAVIPGGGRNPLIFVSTLTGAPCTGAGPVSAR